MSTTPTHDKTGEGERPRLLFLLLLLVLPAKILADHHALDDRFLSLMHFGEDFAANALPEVRGLEPPLFPAAGYDGQFYAQIALRPTLTDPALPGALDNPTYRTRRIGLPALAHVVGLGDPLRVLVAYALLNVVFWLLLLAIVVRVLGLRTGRDLSLAVALLWSGGVVHSLDAALTDLPAAVLALAAVVAANRAFLSPALTGLATLVRETSVLTALSLPEFRPPVRLDWRFFLRFVLPVLVPFAVWLVYARLRLGDAASPGLPGLGWPLVGLSEKVLDNVTRLASPDHTFAYRLASLLCVIAIVTQSVYLFARPRPDSAWWRFGIGLAVLAVFASSAVWIDDKAYTRVLLPLAFAFNLLLREHETGRRYRIWYMVGNGGLFWPAVHCLLR